MDHVYYKLSNGDMVSKRKVDDALNTIRSICGGASIVHLEDSEVMLYGDKIDAIRLFREKYDCSLMEAKASIDFLRE